VTPTSTATPVIPSFNHFQCYEIDRRPFPIIQNVLIDDHFGTTIATLGRPARFCNPADKRDEDPTAPGDPDHLTGYRIEGSTASFTRVEGVQVLNQFGSIFVDMIRPEFLLVPTAKDILEQPPPPIEPAIDHFKCYRVGRGRERQRGIKVVDQFGQLTIDVKKPIRLCVPASKNDEGILDPLGYLMCYRVRSRPPRPLFSGPFFTADQFGENTRHVTRATELCVPSAVVLPPPFDQ
jgi:hypothetical protein